MTKTYKMYRNYGHTRWTSFWLALPVWALLLGSVTAGIVISFFIPAGSFSCN